MRKMKITGEENMSRNKQNTISCRMSTMETSAEAALLFTFMEESVCCKHGMMWCTEGNKTVLKCISHITDKK